MKHKKRLIGIAIMIIAAMTVLTTCESTPQAGGRSAGSGTDTLNSLLRGARTEIQIWDEGTENERSVTIYWLDFAKRDELFQAVQEAGFYQVWSGEYIRDWDLQRGVLRWCVSPDIEKWTNDIQFSAAGETTVYNYGFRLLLGGNVTISGGTATLTSNFTITGEEWIAKNLVIPEGVTLDLIADGARLFLLDGATLTVNGTVNARGGWGDSGHSGSLCIEDGTTIINGSGTIYLKSKGNLLNIWGGNGRKLTLDGVTLVGVEDNNGPLVDVNNGGEFIMKNGMITGNTHISNDSAWGGGVNMYQATFIMEGGKISGNNVTGGVGASGSGVAIGEESVFTMTGGAITGNTATSGRDAANGVGVIVAQGGTFIMEGGEISGNNAVGGRNGNGAGVGLGYGPARVAAATFIMRGGVISGNTATGGAGGSQGGGVSIGRGGDFIMEGGTIYGRANSLPAGTDASLANSAQGNASLHLGNNEGTTKWGTGGRYTRGGAPQTPGSDIVPINSGTDETLIATTNA